MPPLSMQITKRSQSSDTLSSGSIKRNISCDLEALAGKSHSSKEIAGGKSRRNSELDEHILLNSLICLTCTAHDDTNCDHSTKNMQAIMTDIERRLLSNDIHASIKKSKKRLTRAVHSINETAKSIQECFDKLASTVDQRSSATDLQNFYNRLNELTEEVEVERKQALEKFQKIDETVKYFIEFYGKTHSHETNCTHHVLPCLHHNKASEEPKLIVDVHHRVNSSIRLGSIETKGEWTENATFDSETEFFSTVQKGGNEIYFVGGYKNNHSVDDMLRWTKATNTFEKLSSMSIGVYDSAATLANEKIYVCGGGNRANDEALEKIVQIYDISTNEWSFGKNMIECRCGASAAQYEDSIYVCGGFGQQTMEVLHLDSGEWELLSSKLNEPRLLHATAAFGGGIVASGGVGSRYSTPQTVEYFDLMSMKWYRIADMKARRWYHSMTAIGNLLCAIGGVDSSNTMEIYDPRANTWQISNI